MISLSSSMQVTTPSLYNVGRTYLLREDDVRASAYNFFEKAAGMGCPYSKWELYKTKGTCDDDGIDAGVLLESMRSLQDIASSNHFLAAVELCKKYVTPEYGSKVNEKSAVVHYRKVKIRISHFDRRGPLNYKLFWFLY